MSLRNPDFRLGTFRERETQTITATIKDQLGVAIPGASLTTCTMTLYSEHTLNILNSRNDVDIRANVSALGVLTQVLTAADMAIENNELPEERHRLLLEWTYDSGKEGRAELQITVSNMALVP